MAAPLNRGAVAAGAVAVVALATPLIAKWEGLALDPYWDLAKVRTVCYGETVGVQERRYTPQECKALLQRRVYDYAGPVLDCLPESAPIEVKAAFTSFSYNVGTKAACGSVAAQRARARDYPRACNALMNWVYVGKRRVQGLVNRRSAERDLCLKGVV